MTFKIYDSRERKKVEFIPVRGNNVDFYSCGPTVYNRVHIGNLRAFLFADTLQRWLRYGKKYNVKWVMNITDVDDKTIRDSKQRYPELDPKKALQKFTLFYEELFFQDLKKLGIQKSDFYKNPRATEYIFQMQNLVQKIIDNGYGYVRDDSVYFDLKRYVKDYKYGHLADIDFDKMKSTLRVESDEYEKENIADFVLWKAKKEGEPEWNLQLRVTNYELNRDEIISLPGRPGWHLECSAMEESLFELPFDIHSGGVDLCFPHHEDEIAQSTAGYKIDPTRYWVHNEHLMVEGKKMSKSLGNFYTLEDLEQKGFSPEVIRFFLVTNHYRGKLNLSEESLEASKNTLKRLRNFVRENFKKNSHQDYSLNQKKEKEDKSRQFRQRFFDAMNDDLNTPIAISVFFEMLSEDKIFQEDVYFVESVLGVSFFSQEKNIPEEVQNLFLERKKAREEKNWEKSDRLRDIIFEMGFEVRDSKNEGEILFREE